MSCAAIASVGLTLAASQASALVEGNYGFQRRAVVPVAPATLQYHGGPVLHSSDDYVIFWDPIGTYRGDWERLIDRYFADVGAASGTLEDILAVNEQYHDSGGVAANQSTFRGSYKDEDPYPTTAEGGNCTQEAAVICLTDRQIQGELRQVISSADPPLPGATGTPVYYVLTPPGVTVCTEATSSPSTCSYSEELAKETSIPAKTGICGYHSALNLGGEGPIPYVVQPWVAGYAGLILSDLPTPDVLACQNDLALQEPNQETELNPFGNYAEGLADLIVNDLSIEQRNVIVDPFLNGWYQTATNAEESDACQFEFGPPPEGGYGPGNKNTRAGTASDVTINGDPYYIEWAFDSAAVTNGASRDCTPGVNLEPYFTAPNPVNAGDVVGFNGTESDISLDPNLRYLEPDEPYWAPIYKWEFGDGQRAEGVNAASEFHTYQCPGTYTAKLTVIDGGRNVRFTERAITVEKDGIGEGGCAAGGGAGSSSSSASSSSSSPGGGAAGAGHAPSATATVLSRSLKSVLSKGLLVSYFVNEQVAGHFEVLLAASTAHHLGLHGPLATGLAAGTPPQIVIARAVLVTTKGGRNTLKIQFSKTTAARLRRLSKVSLLVRFAVHNGSNAASPTTVLSLITLSH